MGRRSWKRLVVGDRLATDKLQHEKIPKWKALAVLSSDALSSVAYATEEVLIPLALFSIAAVAWSMPIAVAIGVLIFIVTVSYRQTIQAYPNGGGAYTVARENLGESAGLVAGGSLLIDYVLTVAVSVSAGIENIASAFPSLLPYKVGLGVVVILLIMVMNLRGVRESANIFAIPTYLFIGSFVIMIAVGAWKIMMGIAPAAAPVVHEVYPAIPLFLLLRAFSSGCVALTGIEAISNGIPIFKEPSQKNAKITMAWMALILGSFFLAITLLAHLYGVTPREGQTAVSVLARKIFGESFFFYVIPAATTMILLLAANTSYADFPRLASLLAKDRFLPRQLASLGDRLVFSNGIVGLSLAAILLIILFKGDTHLLIPLYAIGVFLSFTLSQGGMIAHHLRDREAGWKKGLVFNVLGAVTTFTVLVVIGITKFVHGAWLVVIMIPAFVIVFRKIRDHYQEVALELSRSDGFEVPQVRKHLHVAIVPVSGIHFGVFSALNYARSISSDVRACFVEIDPSATEKLMTEWQIRVPDVPLVVLKSPYRSVIGPLVRYIHRAKHENSEVMVTVIIPEFVTRRWYHNLLHNQTALALTFALRARRDIVVTSVRYHIGIAEKAMTT